MTSQQTAQPVAEEPGSELLSVSTFSSGSSFGEDTNYKTKFEEERERNRKLNEKLFGYRTVVNQFSKEEQSRAQLKDKIADLERELAAEKSKQISQHIEVVGTTNQGDQHLVDKGPVCQEVFTELSTQPQSGLGSKTTNSPSFVIIQHCRQEVPSPQNNTHTHPEQPQHNSQDIRPFSYHTDALIAKESLSAFYQKGCDYSHGHSFNRIESENKTNIPMNQQGATFHKQQQHPSFSGQSPSFDQSSIRSGSGNDSQPKVPVEGGCVITEGRQEVTSPIPATTTTTMSTGLVSITAWAGQTVKPTWQREQEGLTSGDSSHHQPGRHNSGSSTQLNLMTPSTHSNTSPHVQPQQLIPLNPEGKQYGDQYTLSKKEQYLRYNTQNIKDSHESNSGFTQISNIVFPRNTPVEAFGHQEKTNTQCEASNIPSPPIPADTTSSQNGPRPTTINGQELTTGEAMAPGQPVGVGARLKAKNNLCELPPLMNLFPPPLPTVNPDHPPVLLANRDDFPVQVTNQKERPLETSSCTDVERSGVTESTQEMVPKPSNIEGCAESNDLSENTILDHFEQWVNIGPEDLMKFPSLKSSTHPSPVDTPKENRGLENEINAKGSQPELEMNQLRPQGMHAVSERQVLATPSDEDRPQLASQAHSMAATLGQQAGISDMLYRFAKTASSMEAKLVEYQAQIQRQQVQIQRHNSSEREIQQLRKENETLLSYINEIQAQGARPMVLEPGWTTVEKPVHSSPPPPTPSELTKKVASLEEINGRLFLANKEWFTKWEALRHQTTGEQRQLEARLQAYMADMEKLQRDVSTMEDQLKAATTARQGEKKKNLQLEQEKLNMMKTMENLQTQLEYLSQEKRRLQAEKGPSGAKASELDDETSYQELKSNNGLLKQQLKVFQSDFLKEREDRTKAEAKVEKLRKDREALKQDALARAKKNQALVKTKEEDIRQKSKQLADLQYQLDEVKRELHQERRKSQQANKASQKPSGRHTAPLAHSTMAGPQHQVLSQTAPVRQAPGHQQAPSPPQLSPEHLPGAWQCRDCTFINFPERTVCDICGWKNIPGQMLIPDSEAQSGVGELQSRGGHLQNGEINDGDIEIDTEATPGVTVTR